MSYQYQFLGASQPLQKLEEFYILNGDEYGIDRFVEDGPFATLDEAKAYALDNILAGETYEIVKLVKRVKVERTLVEA